MFDVGQGEDHYDEADSYHEHEPFSINVIKELIIIIIIKKTRYRRRWS
jgi:hypothetical protein